MEGLHRRPEGVAEASPALRKEGWQVQIKSEHISVSIPGPWTGAWGGSHLCVLEGDSQGLMLVSCLCVSDCLYKWDSLELSLLPLMGELLRKVHVNSLARGHNCL